MQYLGRNFRTLYVWRAEATEDDPDIGDAVKRYTRAERINIAVYPIERSREQASQGVLPTDRYQGITHNIRVHTGDRIGDWGRPLYRVASTVPRMTVMEMVLEAIEPDAVI
jgi:hypothetical protein